MVLCLAQFVFYRVSSGMCPFPALSSIQTRILTKTVCHITDSVVVSLLCNKEQSHGLVEFVSWCEQSLITACD